jgi:anti-sigma factor ChrR (cupin superfamily)
MTQAADQAWCRHTDDVPLYALGGLAPTEMSALAAHIDTCARCREELAALRKTVDCLVFWPTDVLRPSTDLWRQLARRVAEESGAPPVASPLPQWSEPDWEEVAPGITCKLLATDTERQRVSMLVTLAPGVAYPPHRHAGIEELHLLDGELWIDDLKLYPGDYHRAARGTSDARVWSETGCTCVLITSALDELV